MNENAIKLITIIFWSLVLIGLSLKTHIEIKNGKQKIPKM